MNNTTDLLLQQVIDRLGEIADKLDGVNERLSELSTSVTELVDSSAIVDEIDKLRGDIGKKGYGSTIADKTAATAKAIEGLKEDFGEKLEELTAQLISGRSDIVEAIEGLKGANFSDLSDIVEAIEGLE